MIFYVYILFRNLEHTDPFYIGKGRGARIYSHSKETNLSRDRNYHKTNTIRKVLKQFGTLPSCIFAEQLDNEEACIIEEWLINYFGRRDLNTGCLTNLTNGGDGVSNMSQKARDAISNSNRTRNWSLEAREILRQNMLGKQYGLGWVPSKEYREKKRLQMMGNKHLLGHKHTEESKRKISEGCKGKCLGNTHGHVNRGKKRGPLSLEHRAKIKAGVRKYLDARQAR